MAASIGGGYSKPDVRELLGAQIAMLPVTLYKARPLLYSICMAYIKTWSKGFERACPSRSARRGLCCALHV